MPVADLLKPEKLWTRRGVLSRPCPVPAEPGVYAWYFKALPDPEIDPSGLHLFQGHSLLYVGISPKKPLVGKPSSRQNLRTRLRYHYRGNAFGSTVRLTLGCLLGEQLGIELRRVGSGKRLTFASGEEKLSDWMAANSMVCWLPAPAPWELEERLIAELDLPLNLDQNQSHGFHQRLRERRAKCRKTARELPVVSA